MYSFHEDSNFRYDSDESEQRTYEESNESEDEIDSDIEAALYSQIHHLENPSYEPTIEETNSSQTKDNFDDKTKDGDKSLNHTLDENKVTLSSSVIISDESDDCNVDIVKNNDVEFLCEMKSNINNGKCNNDAKNYQKKWWEKFVSDTYNDNDVGDVLLDDDKNIRSNHINQLSTNLRDAIDLESRHIAFSCKKNKTKNLSTSQVKDNVTIHPSESSSSIFSFKSSETKPLTASAKNNARAHSSKRKRNDSTSSEDNAFKHMKHRAEGKDVLINLKPSVITVDLTKNDDELWQICSQDIHNSNKESRRYYTKQMRTICNNCSERGHISRDCKSPRKLPVCYVCGKIGHEAGCCLNPACTSCLAVGHTSKQCQWSNFTVERCPNCNMWDHLREECPDRWRRYHMTTTPGPIICRNTSRNKTVFCYNCARQGHFGHECNMERMDRYSFPTSPFISHYSEPETKFVDYTASNKQAKINARFKKLSKKKEKSITQANKQFEKGRKFLQKKAERLIRLASSPSAVKYEKPRKDKKRPLLQDSTTNETSLSFASSSQETSNVSELGSKFCIPQKKKRRVRKKAKPLPLPQSIVKQVKETKKCNKKKMKKLQKAITKSEINGNNAGTSNNNSAITVANILRSLVPEVSFSMACMKLFSGKS